MEKNFPFRFPSRSRTSVSELQRELEATSAQLRDAEERVANTRMHLCQVAAAAPRVDGIIKTLIEEISAKTADDIIERTIEGITNDPEILSHLDEARDIIVDKYMDFLGPIVRDHVWDSWREVVGTTNDGSLFTECISNKILVQPARESGMDTYIVSYGGFPWDYSGVSTPYRFYHHLRRRLSFENEIGEADVKGALEDVTRHLY
ncbi:hypothetical protein I302_108677 [Kwoniella bestiolae CBS 10118]|uniref:Uncharacterized protein n=1 Tax=Kwoniella bestiolae CBS 10118 TaxID=1296100 RepID=A0A1B9FTT4_9TREE|nr:hypothetical protein I302_07812 [Kwoniella bestiolae CBS 10118]OCF22168.1 hypothetical protein I302_07812 [Kwoniella bestiolae CBS 10118]